MRHSAAVIALVFCVTMDHANEDSSWIGIPVDASAIVRQEDVGTNACGVASVVSALQLGDELCHKALARLKGKSGVERANEIIDRYGTEQSRHHEGRARVLNGGAHFDDLADILTDAVRVVGLEARAISVDRGDDEADAIYLRRVHGLLSDTLRTGRPPLLSLVAAVADCPDSDGHEAWRSVCAHVVVVTRVPTGLSEHDRGFMFEFVDPTSGRTESGYVYVESSRQFLAQKGYGEHWEQKSGSPFLLATTPTLRMGFQNEPMYARTLNHRAQLRGACNLL